MDDHRFPHSTHRLRKTSLRRSISDQKGQTMELTKQQSLLDDFDDRPFLMKLPSKANDSWFTDETETTSLSDDGEDEEDSLPYYGAIRIDDFLASDEKDSMSVASLRSSLSDLAEEEEDPFFRQGLPREVIVLADDPPLHNDDDVDMEQRLRMAEMLAQSYRAKMQSTEALTDSLHEYLKQAQTYAEDVLADRNELLQQIHDMQEEDRLQIDQSVLSKVILGGSLCYYICGGSPVFLACAVGLNLVADVVNVLF